MIFAGSSIKTVSTIVDTDTGIMVIILVFSLAILFYLYKNRVE